MMENRIYYSRTTATITENKPHWCSNWRRPGDTCGHGTKSWFFHGQIPNK